MTEPESQRYMVHLSADNKGKAIEHNKGKAIEQGLYKLRLNKDKFKSKYTHTRKGEHKRGKQNIIHND